MIRKVRGVIETIMTGRRNMGYAWRHREAWWTVGRPGWSIELMGMIICTLASTLRGLLRSDLGPRIKMEGDLVASDDWRRDRRS